MGFFQLVKFGEALREASYSGFNSRYNTIFFMKEPRVVFSPSLKTRQWANIDSWNQFVVDDVAVNCWARNVNDQTDSD